MPPEDAPLLQKTAELMSIIYWKHLPNQIPGYGPAGLRLCGF